MGRQHLKPEQCRAARGLLNWRARDLASRSGVSAGTIGAFESGARSTHPAVVRVLLEELEAGGVIFFQGDDGAPGVRLSLRAAA